MSKGIPILGTFLETQIQCHPKDTAALARIHQVLARLVRWWEGFVDMPVRRVEAQGTWAETED